MGRKAKSQKRSQSDIEIEDVIDAHYSTLGANNWSWLQVTTLARTIGCSPDALLSLCGVTADERQGRSMRDWKANGMPGAVSLTLAIVAQFVEFNISGKLTPPIIPLEAVLSPRRIKKVQKGRRKEIRRRHRVRIRYRKRYRFKRVRAEGGKFAAKNPTQEHKSSHD